MCGIVGYIGPRQATPIILDGLKRLEYRGYDSAGLAVSQASITRPSLDEVYLAVTGRSFSKADAEAAPAARRWPA